MVATGCGGKGNEPAEAGPSQKATCRGVAKPVSIETVERVLANSGFSVRRIPDSAICYQTTTDPAEDILADLNNDRSSEDVKAREGSIDCAVYRGPIYPDTLHKDLHESANSPIFSGRKAVWWFKNVECDIYAGESHPDEQVKRLDRAIERLARTTR